MSSASFPDQLLSLHHFISRLLPDPAPSDAPAKIASWICKACQHSLTELHDSERCKDEIWKALRSFSASPTPANIDHILRMVTVLSRQSTAMLNDANVFSSISRTDTRLSQWNRLMKTDFERIVLSSGTGSRINDPRNNNIILQKKTSTTAAASSSSRASHSRIGFDPAWLRNRCAQLAVCQSGGATAHEMAISVMLQLCNQSLTDEHLQSYLYDSFAGDFDAVVDVLQKRPLILTNRDAVQADGEQARAVHEQMIMGTDVPVSSPSPFYNRAQQSNQNQQQHQQQFSSNIYVRDVRQERQSRRSKRTMKTQSAVNNDDDDFVVNNPDFGASAFEERQRAFPGVAVQNDTAIGSVERVGLPKGTTREVGKGYEEIFVPPPERKSVRDNELVDVATGLAGHPELLQAMKGVKTLNRLQSAVFPVAFKSDENMLVCAPTGAGKTNVALLTIFREIVSVKLREKRNFKVVYVAPMKALAAEVTEKFTARLGPLGLAVREFTGDISPSRAETLATHVLVTTPEKWDVVTRKTGSEVGEALTLFIIDEVHLLHDERGAVLESIVARTLRFSETAQRQIRLVGLSATLPNYEDVGSFMRVNPKKGLFHFDASHRPVPLSQTFIGISEGQNSSSSEARRRKEAKVHEMAWKKVKDSLLRGHQAMIFVHSRKGTANAAREMLNRATQDAVGDIFLGGQIKPGKLSENNGREKGDDDDNGPPNVMPSWAAKEIGKSKTAEIRELCMRGIGIHNAGLPRPDRKLVERLFAEGLLRLLCCTATLAWGVNLPARTVVIMGTEVYNAEKGRFEQLGMLDVMQIFGRAGRPQFDTEGEGSIITDHEHLSKYLNLLTSSVPIESQLGSSASRMADHLNAEIVSGTVSSIGDGVRWLSYTYLSVRMPKNPLVYGINWAEVQEDEDLHIRRAQLIEQAAKALDDARMCRYDDRTGALSPLDLGRVSSHFYVSHETVLLWTEQLNGFSYGPAITVSDWKLVYGTVIHAVACATEFEQVRSRDEESEELLYLMKQACPVPLKTEYGTETREGKVSILLQAHISRANIRMSDLSYIVQSATRLLRALFEISLRRGMPSVSVAALELARASDSRIWPFQHPLWQFTYLARRERGLLITPETIAGIESSGESTDLTSLRSRTREQLSELIRAPRIVNTVEKVLKAVPTLQIVDAKVAPLSKTLLSIDVKLLANFSWNDILHGMSESWWLWIEDKDEYRIYHSQKVTLTKRQLQELNGDIQEGQRPGEVQKQTLDMSFKVAVFDPPSAKYWVRIESDRWHTGGGSTAELLVANMQLPSEESFKTDVSTTTSADVRRALRGPEADWFVNQKLTRFNLPQTAIMYTACNSNENMLICSPSGCGQLSMMELVMFRALKSGPKSAVVILALNEGSLQLMKRRWKLFLTSEAFRPDIPREMLIMADLDSSSRLVPEQIGTKYGIIATTPRLWIDFIHPHAAKEHDMLSKVSTIIIQDLHRSSQPSNSATELVVSRLRSQRRFSNSAKHQQQQNQSGIIAPRLVAFSAVIPNAPQVADWLGVSRKMGLFCFGDEARPIACETYMISVAGDRYASRMQSINRPLYSTIQRHSHKKPVLIFVSSRRQSLLTAKDLLRLASLDGKEALYVGKTTHKRTAGSLNKDEGLQRDFRPFNDPGLSRLVPKGIALLHEHMSNADREAVEELFSAGHILVVVATFEMAASISLRAHSVIIKGTETFNLKWRRYEDISIPDIVHMIGRAGRFGIDDTSYATIFVHEPRLTLFKKLVREPLALESGLLDAHFDDILLGEVAEKKINDMDESLTWLRNMMLFQRLHTNPGKYGLNKGVTKKREKAGIDEQTFEAERRTEFCTTLMMKHFERLKDTGCVLIQQGHTSGSGADTNRRRKPSKHITIQATKLGQLCRRWNICTESGSILKERLNEFVKTLQEKGDDGSQTKLRIEEVMNVLSTCDEVKELGKDYEEDAVWKEVLGRVVRYFVQCDLFPNEDTAARVMKLNGWVESSQKRGKLLCYSILTKNASNHNLPPPGGRGITSGSNDRGNRLESRKENTRALRNKQIEAYDGVFSRVLNFGIHFAMDIATSADCVKQLVLMRQCVSMRRPPCTDFWKLCPAVFENSPESKRSAAFIVNARKEGWTSLRLVRENQQEFAKLVSRSCDETQRAAIMRWVIAWPEVRIMSAHMSSVSDGGRTLSVALDVRGNDDASETEIVVVVSARGDNSLVGAKRIVVPEAETEVNIDFDAGPEVVTGEPVSIWAACEKWIGVEDSLVTSL